MRLVLLLSSTTAVATSSPSPSSLAAAVATLVATPTTAITMGLTDFQKKKVLNLFENLYDTNKDGVIEKCDFDEAVEKISTLHHWKHNDDAFKKAQDTVNKIWDGLRERADKNKDGKITKEEWTRMWEECIKDVMDGKSFPAWQQEYMEFMFYANDTSGDGFIDRGEYTAIYKLFGFSNDDVNVCFDKISEGLPNNMLSKENFEALWREYFTAEDDSAKGNFLFGQQKH